MEERSKMDNILLNTTDAYGYALGLQFVRVHSREKCAGTPCCIHNPSDHHMKDWPQLWRDDRKMMERTCPHGVGHPDPDDTKKYVDHGCDGCCMPDIIYVWQEYD